MHVREKICTSAPAPRTPPALCFSPPLLQKRGALGRASFPAFLNPSFLSPLPPAPFPCGRSKLLRRNDDHPSRNRCEGGRLHHLPLPQRGLVEAGAVCPAGVPQWPDAVLDGGWKSPTEAPSTAVFCATERTGAQFLS